MRFAASMVLFGTKATLFLMKTKPIRTAPNRLQKPGSENPKRARVLQAVAEAFSGTETPNCEIAFPKGD
jgi:hypothetical protein